MEPVWPPPSLPVGVGGWGLGVGGWRFCFLGTLPWAHMMSQPAARAYSACFTAPTMFMTAMPASCSLVTAQAGGTPTAHTNKRAPDCEVGGGGAFVRVRGGERAG